MTARPVLAPGLTRRVEQPADRDLVGQLVVDLDRLLGFQDVYLDRPLLQVPQRGRVGVQLPVHAERQDDHRRAVREQFLNVGDLDARYVPGTGFGPVPLPPATGVELVVLGDAETLTSIRPQEMSTILGERLPWLMVTFLR
jgi:hypothetical protein